MARAVRTGLATAIALAACGVLASLDLVQGDSAEFSPSRGSQWESVRLAVFASESVERAGAAASPVVVGPPAGAQLPAVSAATDFDSEFERERRAGHEFEGELKVSAEGRFIPNESARRLFESYYTRFSQQSDDLVRGRVVLHVLDTLPPRAADQAIEVLDRWRRARNAVRALEEDAPVEELRVLRRTALGPELHAAFYAE
jgi:hypothetical protein